MRKIAKLGAGLVIASMLSVSFASAQETLKVAAGQRGNWDTSVSEIGKRAGIFKKYGLDLDILYTQGSGETQQAVISGAVDVGIAIGTIGAMAAFSRAHQSASSGPRSLVHRICSGMCARIRPSKISRTRKVAPSPIRPMVRRLMAL